MKPQRPIREISDFLIHQIQRSTRQSHLDILRDMLDRVLLQAYSGDEKLGDEYCRVDVELRTRERQLGLTHIEMLALQPN